MDRVKKSSPELSEVRVGYTYAVHCIDEDPGKDVIERCSKFLAASLANAAKESGRRPVLLVMGTAACKAAGIKTKKLADVQSRVLTTTIQDVEYTAVVTVSAKMVASMPGMFNIFESDATRAIKLAAMTVTGGTKDQPSLDELTKNYLLPTTVEGVRTLIDTVLSYGEDSDSWSIAIDTETNTKFPHRANAKIVAISVAWDTGKAGAFAMWHPNAPYNPEDLVPDVVRLLQSKKPKALHNAKFDLKMFARYGWSVENFAWDTMLVEHCLEEDKKGQYGLKQLTRVNFPEFGSYADELAEQKTKQEGDSQLENIRKQQRDAEADPLLTPTKKKAGKKKHADGGFENVDLGVLLKYAAVDTDMTRRLSLLQISRIKKEQAAYEQAKLLETRRRTRKYEVPNLPPGKFPVADAFRGISKPVVHELADMEMRGIRVDQDKVRFLDQELGKIIATAEQTLYGLAGTADLKLNSAAAVANVLFNHGYIDPATGRRVVHAPVSVTATGQAQTTEKVLKALVARSGCKFSAQKLIYAKAYKAKNTFIANVRDLSSLDGFLHTNYNQHGTATFRLSSNDENMQNIPKKLAGHSIKQIFVPDDDSYVLVNADAKGAEVRIFTAYSRDPDLIRSLNEGQDTHCFIGSRIVAVVRERPHEAKEVLAAIGLDDDYPLTYEDFAARDQLKQSRPAYGEMLDKFRTAVKRVVFGILYGAAAPKIAETIGISQDQAQQIIDLLFKLYPSIPRYMEQTKWELATFGMVETYFGRRRRFSVKSAPRYMLRRAERQAVNFKIQSTSSDIVMGRLVAAAKPLRYDVGGRMLLTVHDSLGFQWPKKYLNQLPEFIDKYLVKGAAEAHPWLPVAFNWDFEVGPNYGDLKPYEVYLKNHPTLIQQDLLEEAYGEDDIESDLKDADAE
jgi:DNA polymerase I-like protein with 3'-5' exonuclease and polymerase domains